MKILLPPFLVCLLGLGGCQYRTLWVDETDQQRSASVANADEMSCQRETMPDNIITATAIQAFHQCMIAKGWKGVTKPDNHWGLGYSKAKDSN